MANINDLNLIEEDAPEVAVENLPSQFGSYSRPLQPGTYSFQLPAKEVLANCFEVRDGQENGTPVRVVDAVFEGAAKLKVLGHEPYETKIGTLRVPRGKDKIPVSDMTYLLQALGHDKPVRGTKGQIEALLEHAGEWFDADVSWFARCSKDKDIYVQTEEGTKKKEGTKGCGSEFSPESYTKKNGTTVYEIPKVDGEFADRFACTCGASVRAFTNLRNYQPSKVK